MINLIFLEDRIRGLVSPDRERSNPLTGLLPDIRAGTRHLLTPVFYDEIVPPVPDMLILLGGRVNSSRRTI